MTTICRSLENHVSRTMTIGFSFPICPAGIVRVRRVPCALTPEIVWVPRSSFLRWPEAISSCSRASTFSLNASRRKRSEEHTSELQSRGHLVCRLLLEQKKNLVRTITGRLYRTKDQFQPS